MSQNSRVDRVRIFLLGAVCGCVLTFVFKRVSRWLFIRILPAQHLQEHPVRRRDNSESAKEVVRGK